MLDVLDELHLAFGFNGQNGASIDSRGSFIPLHSDPRGPDDLPPADLVIQNPKRAAQILLGRVVELSLEYLDFPTGALSQRGQPRSSHRSFLVSISSSQSRGPFLLPGSVVPTLISTMSPSDF